MNYLSVLTRSSVHISASSKLKSFLLYLFVLIFSSFLLSCASSSQRKANDLDKMLSKLEKKKRKKGQKVSIEHDDVYASKKNKNEVLISSNTDLAVEEKKIREAKVKVTENKSFKAAKAGNHLVSFARDYLGTPHQWGGMTKRGLDCSGLMVLSYNSLDINIPRNSYEQSKVGKSVGLNDLQKGDLLFFTFPGGSRINHVGMVSEVRGKNDILFIHTSSSKGVREDNLFSNYWRKIFIKAKRVI